MFYKGASNCGRSVFVIFNAESFLQINMMHNKVSLSETVDSVLLGYSVSLSLFSINFIGKIAYITNIIIYFLFHLVVVHPLRTTGRKSIGKSLT